MSFREINLSLLLCNRCIYDAYRILNTLPSRIWDGLFFLFSDYLTPPFGEMEFSRRLCLSGKLIYPFFSVVAVFMMLVRILNTLPSRIWNILFFLFSGYSKSTVGEKGIRQMVMDSRESLKD